MNLHQSRDLTIQHLIVLHDALLPKTKATAHPGVFAMGDAQRYASYVKALYQARIDVQRSMDPGRILLALCKLLPFPYSQQLYVLRAAVLNHLPTSDTFHGCGYRLQDGQIVYQTADGILKPFDILGDNTR